MVTVLDACTDDIGARANFGRGTPKGTEKLAYEQFMMKFANAQMNRHNTAAIERCYLLG
jgi:arginase family enzyme